VWWKYSYSRRPPWPCSRGSWAWWLGTCSGRRHANRARALPFPRGRRALRQGLAISGMLATESGGVEVEIHRAGSHRRQPIEDSRGRTREARGVMPEGIKRTQTVELEEGKNYGLIWYRSLGYWRV
jgi:hypothetical protein